MIAVLVDIRSRENVGSIFRTSDAVGIKKIYLVGITPAPVDRFGRVDSKLRKASLGAEKSVPWEHVENLEKLISHFKKYTVVAVEQDRRSQPYYTYRPSTKEKSRIALIVGNEVEGLSPRVLDLAPIILEIPMTGSKESLNVAVAFGIVAYSLQYGVS